VNAHSDWKTAHENTTQMIYEYATWNVCQKPKFCNYNKGTYWCDYESHKALLNNIPYYSIACVYITKVLLGCYIRTQLCTNKNSIYAVTFATATTPCIMLFKAYIYTPHAPAVGIVRRKPSFPPFPVHQMG
jgi:hypothetical protein